MTYPEIDILNEKAKSRKDGIYSYKTYFYAVKNNRFIAFTNYFGECYQRMGGFNVSIGNMPNRFIAKDKLKEWLKCQK